ncbi:MAG: hypothetical protein ACD_9C00051G0004 [uncultured bacterium]|nr:MAG: hypothetical protein ACD_9C00051G0004 [uncultured bacterium]
MHSKFCKNRFGIICRTSKSGFSMYEVLIVLFLMMIMTGVIFIGRSGNKAAADVETASRQIGAQIRALQNEALNGKRFDTDGDGTLDTNACLMRFNTNPMDATKSYKTGYYDCNALPALITGSEQAFFLGKSSSNKSVNVEGDYYIQFSSPRGDIGTNLPVYTTTWAIEIKSKDDTMKNLVCIYSNGSVVETKAIDEDDTAVCP